MLPSIVTVLKTAQPLSPRNYVTQSIGEVKKPKIK